jgi:hypothetical protein
MECSSIVASKTSRMCGCIKYKKEMLFVQLGGDVPSNERASAL